MNLFFCPQCGAKLDNDAHFCPDCGFDLKLEGTSDTPAEPVKAVSSDTGVMTTARSWGALDTVLLILLLLLQAAALFLLYLVFLKWPHETAVEYYAAEESAYTEQIREYEALSSEIADENMQLDDQIDVLQLVLDSGGEPADPETAEHAEASIRRALSYRVEAPVIEADPIRVPEKNNVFHTKEIMAAAKSIDQSRFGLYNRYRDLLSVPDYTSVINELALAEADLQRSIDDKAEADSQMSNLQDFFMDFESFILEYCSSLSNPDEFEMNTDTTPEEMQQQYEDWISRYNSLDFASMSSEEEAFARSEYSRLMVLVADASGQTSDGEEDDMSEDEWLEEDMSEDVWPEEDMSEDVWPGEDMNMDDSGM